jgi:hypothetical protein
MGATKLSFFAQAFALPDRSREDLNNPPTAVGGICTDTQRGIRSRKDLNNPPTAVGGICDFFVQKLGCAESFFPTGPTE